MEKINVFEKGCSKAMDWFKQAKQIKVSAKCDGIFSLQDYADYTVLAACNYPFFDSQQSKSRELQIKAHDILSCPVNDLVFEGRKAVRDHLKKVALSKSGRYFGDPQEIAQIDEKTPTLKLKELLENSTRSVRHNVDKLRQKLQQEGVSWDEASEAMAMASLYSERLHPMDYYIGEFQGQERFKDYNWQYLIDTLDYLERQFSSDTRIRPLIEAFDLAINAAHNTTTEPVTFLYDQVRSNVGLVRDEEAQLIQQQPVARSLGDSVLTYMQEGTAIFPYLNAKRNAKTAQKAYEELQSLASPEAIQIAKIADSQIARR